MIIKSFKIFESVDIKEEELKSQFNDIEDYFIDLFDESNQEWDIRVSMFFGDSIRVHLTKRGLGHAHRYSDLETILVKRNPTDIIVSKCMDRLASAKGYRAKYKKKRWRSNQAIGYICSLFEKKSE